MLRYLILLSAILVVLAIVFGCDDRGTGITPVDLGELENWPGVDPSPSHPFTPALTLQLRNPQELLLGSAYWPPEAVSVPPTHPLPLLVLLAPETGNRYYYFKAGLGELARELTASGLIQPMVIYCMANDQTFGGFFYGNSDPAGRYDSIFNSDGIPFTSGGRDDLLEYLHSHYPATIELPSKRGIGGIGQGAYGAFRAAIKNPGMFSSISVADGPLDFDGPTGNSGLISLFDDVITEQETFYALDPDTTADGVPLPFDFKVHFDSAGSMPVSMMFIGGSFAFSPNDTLIQYERRIDSIMQGGMWRYSMRIIVNNRYRIADSLLPGGGDSTTLMTSIVKGDSPSRGLDLHFHLPFDDNGTLYQPIWDYWMRNNLEDMYEAAGGSPLAGVSMWFGTNQNCRWGYYEMTQSWMNFLRGEGYDLEEYRYSSYTDDPITYDEHLFDVLRQMLIFHSNNFGD